MQCSAVSLNLFFFFCFVSEVGQWATVEVWLVDRQAGVQTHFHNASPTTAVAVAVAVVRAAPGVV